MENIKYLVRVYILKSDKEDKLTTENFQYTFEEPNPIDARNKAITKVKDLRVFFEDEMPEESQFISLSEVVSKGFKYNAYSLELVFQTEEDGWNYILFGGKEETIESLEAEAIYYRDNIENQQYDEIEDENGEFVEILESNSDFFLNQYQY